MMTLSDFQALFRVTPYPYLVMTPDLTVVGASGAYLRSVQRTEEEIVGRNVFEAFPAEETNAEATNVTEVKASMLRALAQGHLPEMDGYELARRLRADPATSAALFIALTGYGQAHDRILSKSSGFEHHFVKPMDTDRLGQVLGAVRGRGVS